MKTRINKLLKLIEDGKTLNEICALLHLSREQLYNDFIELKNNGFFFQRKYYENGTMKYVPILSVEDLQAYYKYKDLTRTLITDRNENSFRFLFLADLHFGNDAEEVKLVEEAFDYAKKNGIHIILCGGDLIEGTYSQWIEKDEINIKEQIDHFVKSYPTDPNILTFAVVGNHDVTALTRTSQDIIEIIRNLRHDIVLDGYGNLSLNIKNDYLYMTHRTQGGETNAPIILRAHSHRYMSRFSDKGSLVVTAPSLSLITQTVPTFLDFHINFQYGYIKDVSIRQIYYSYRPYILNEISYNLNRQQGKAKNIKIHNVEKLPEEELKKPYVYQKRKEK